jgi:hypothetical protein
VSSLLQPRGVSVNKQLAHAPLPQMVQKLGTAIAQAQADMDMLGVEMAIQMAGTTVNVGGANRSLLELGLTPSFYTFSEATIEAKVAFSTTEDTSYGMSASVGVNVYFVAASVDASYSRKFSYNASGSSSISARLVSLPAPAELTDLLRSQP